MKKSIFVLILATIFIAGLYGSSLAQKKPENKAGADTMHPQISEKMEDMGKMMAEMQEEMKNMDKMMEDPHAGMNNEEMTKLHERMTQMHEQMRQMRQQLSDMHQQMMRGGEGGMMGRGTMGHDPSTRGGHMGGTEHGTSRGGHEMGSGDMHGGSDGGMMKQKR